MKHIPALFFLLFIACKNNPGTPDNGGVLIPVDSANKMVGSYLNSIDSPGFDNALRSLSIDADVLRDYLNSTEGLDVTEIKIMFAHTLSYINEGNGNVDAGYESGALTLVLAGYDKDGNFVLPGGVAVNNAMPCPANCPPGEAAGDFLPAPTAKHE